MVELLIKLEMSLWINETRNNEKYLEQILHDTFYEIGQSGTKYNKTDILNNLDMNLETSFPFSDISIKEINKGTYLISYVVECKVNSVPMTSYRTSIWLNKDDNYSLLFHQGTTI